MQRLVFDGTTSLSAINFTLWWLRWSEGVLFWKSPPDVVVAVAVLTLLEAELQCGQTGWSRRSVQTHAAPTARPGPPQPGTLVPVRLFLWLAFRIRSNRRKEPLRIILRPFPSPPPPLPPQPQHHFQLQQHRMSPGRRRGSQNRTCGLFLDSVGSGLAAGRLACWTGPVRVGSPPVWGEINGDLVLWESEAQTSTPP